MSDSCPCACHRIVSLLNGEAECFDEAFEVNEYWTNQNRIPCMHYYVPGLDRWSVMFVASNMTLSELPGYQEAVKILQERENQVDRAQEVYLTDQPVSPNS